jgi:hypothetical protein
MCCSPNSLWVHSFNESSRHVTFSLAGKFTLAGISSMRAGTWPCWYKLFWKMVIWKHILFLTVCLYVLLLYIQVSRHLLHDIPKNCHSQMVRRIYHWLVTNCKRRYRFFCTEWLYRGCTPCVHTDVRHFGLPKLEYSDWLLTIVPCLAAPHLASNSFYPQQQSCMFASLGLMGKSRNLDCSYWWMHPTAHSNSCP